MAKKVKKPRPKRERSKQGHLPGMEPPSIPEIDRAADAYVDARDGRMSMLKTETERKAVLQSLMVKHGFPRYEYDGKEVIMDSEPSVKVRRKKVEGEDNGEEE